MQKILVIEDEKNVRETIIELLESAGYLVIAVEDGLKALKAFEEEDIDMVLSDIRMPNMDGFAVLEHFRKLPIASTTPFIFISAKADEESKRFGFGLGADDFLTKPFRAKELIQVIEAQFRKRKKE
jgi:DNA-binding response OmpR family regulator